VGPPLQNALVVNDRRYALCSKAQAVGGRKRTAVAEGWEWPGIVPAVAGRVSHMQQGTVSQIVTNNEG